MITKECKHTLLPDSSFSSVIAQTPAYACIFCEIDRLTAQHALDRAEIERLEKLRAEMQGECNARLESILRLKKRADRLRWFLGRILNSSRGEWRDIARRAVAEDDTALVEKESDRDRG